MVKISAAGRKLIQDSEGLRLKAYQCSANTWTIGWGTTMYPGFVAVGAGDEITKQQAEEYFDHDVEKFERAVGTRIKSAITQRMFDALVSFSYNIGANAFKKSTLALKVDRDPNDPEILAEFKKWDKVDGKPNKGLAARRKKEAEFYFFHYESPEDADKQADLDNKKGVNG